MPDLSRTSVPRIWPASDAPAFRKTFELTLDDHLAVAYSTRQLLPTGIFVGAMSLIALFVALIVNFGLWREGQRVLFALYTAATVAFCAVLAAVLVRPARRLLRATFRRRLVKLGSIGAPIEATVDGHGLAYTVRGQTVSCPWDSLRAIEEEDGTFYFWLSKTVAHVWPARIFASGEERDRFRQSLQSWSGRPVASPPLLARLGAAGRANLPE